MGRPGGAASRPDVDPGHEEQFIHARNGRWFPRFRLSCVPLQTAAGPLYKKHPIHSVSVRFAFMHFSCIHAFFVLPPGPPRQERCRETTNRMRRFRAAHPVRLRFTRKPEIPRVSRCVRRSPAPASPDSAPAPSRRARALGSEPSRRTRPPAPRRREAESLPPRSWLASAAIIHPTKEAREAETETSSEHLPHPSPQSGTDGRALRSETLQVRRRRSARCGPRATNSKSGRHSTPSSAGKAPHEREP